jgi:hypothetical protein
LDRNPSGVSHTAQLFGSLDVLYSPLTTTYNIRLRPPLYIPRQGPPVEKQTQGEVVGTEGSLSIRYLGPIQVSLEGG